MRKSFVLALVVRAVSLFRTGLASAAPSPNGPGQPDAPGTTCAGPAGNANSAPGGAASASGSPFNANGTAGTVCAGNPGTASAAHAASTQAVSPAF
jgi:hypothetical protein